MYVGVRKLAYSKNSDQVLISVVRIHPLTLLCQRYAGFFIDARRRAREAALGITISRIMAEIG
jgi:hypothetical protein